MEEVSMKKKFSKSKISVFAIFAALIVGCSSGTDNPAGIIDTDAYKSYLYLTDTSQGRIYFYDPVERTASSTSLATAAPSAGEIYFRAGKGFVCVGSGSGEGVYRFDPSAANPQFARIGTAIAAQYIAFLSDTKAYVSTYGDGLYYFDPSSASPALSAVSATAGLTLQDVVVGLDDMIYAADYGNDKVIRVHPSTGATATISTNATGTTGLFAGAFNGIQGVFVANNGGWGASPAGSIDFIANNAADLSTATLVSDSLHEGGSIIPSRLVQLEDGDLIATGYGHSYKVGIAGSSVVTKECKDSGASFGSSDIELKDGLVYIPVNDYAGSKSYLYIMGEAGGQVSYSPIPVMGTGAGISNIAFYED
jgi:hypothetical protein